jgi:hypothetical protein
MSAPEFILFTPVPLRVRCDGWSPALQLRFVRLLADGMKPGAAARAVGKNRQNAYALRKRPGAESFAAAWDSAIAFAARRSQALEVAVRAGNCGGEERQERQFEREESSPIGNPKLMKLPRPPVAFHGSALRRPPC